MSVSEDTSNFVEIDVELFEIFGLNSQLYHHPSFNFIRFFFRDERFSCKVNILSLMHRRLLAVLGATKSIVIRKPIQSSESMHHFWSKQNNLDSNDWNLIEAGLHDGKTYNLHVSGPKNCGKSTFIWLHAILSLSNKRILWTYFHLADAFFYVYVDIYQNRVERGMMLELRGISQFLETNQLDILYIDNFEDADFDISYCEYFVKWWNDNPTQRSVVMCSRKKYPNASQNPGFNSMNFLRLPFD
jgi:hypothetical protein